MYTEFILVRMCRHPIERLEFVSGTNQYWAMSERSFAQGKTRFNHKRIAILFQCWPLNHVSLNTRYYFLSFFLVYNHKQSLFCLSMSYYVIMLVWPHSEMNIQIILHHYFIILQVPFFYLKLLLKYSYIIFKPLVGFNDIYTCIRQLSNVHCVFILAAC